jgi:inorganic phosphate transporter, PiT family
MTVFILLFLTTLFVAYANGANDNFKGVATLYGANVASYRKAITIATLATFAGCIASMFFAEALIKAFSAKGLVPDAVAASPTFLISVAAGAGGTVILATMLGFPISTTHGLTGALVGVGFVAAGDELNLSMLGSSFFLPLLVSPMIAVLLTVPLYMAVHALTGRLGIAKESCVCVAPGEFTPVVAFADINAPLGVIDERYGGIRSVSVTTGAAPDCMEKYNGVVLGSTAQKLIDSMHYVSGAAVSFARGLNDTPKIVGLLLVFEALHLHVSALSVAGAMPARWPKP